MARLAESVVMTVLTTLMTDMTMSIYSGIWSWALNEELLPQWKELPARGSQHFLAPLFSQKKFLCIYIHYFLSCVYKCLERDLAMYFSSVSPHVNRWALQSMYTCTHQLWTAFCTTKPVPSEQLLPPIESRRTNSCGCFDFLKGEKHRGIETYNEQKIFQDIWRQI